MYGSAAEVNDFLERKGLAKYAEKIVEVTDVARIASLLKVLELLLFWLVSKKGRVFGLSQVFKRLEL